AFPSRSGKGGGEMTESQAVERGGARVAPPLLLGLARTLNGQVLTTAAVILLAVVSFASLFIGVSDVTPLDVLRLDNSNHQTRVFIESRVPRLAAILLAGSALSVSGLIMQTLVRNRFVAPSTAGTMSSA